MPDEHDEHDEHRRVAAIDAAIRAGDMAALCRAVGDRPMPLATGSCLVYAVYQAPPAFIGELLEMGADVNEDTADGFPPLIAALTCATSQPGSPARPDVLEVIRLLLDAGADPNQRGINDWTPLHAAIGYRALDAIPLLLDAGADPTLRTRIDDYETPAEMAVTAGLDEVAQLLQSWPPDRSSRP